MSRKLLYAALLLGTAPLFAQLLPAEATAQGKLPTETILIKGAAPSATDTRTPLPEDGSITDAVYRNPYLGLAYPLPAGWTESFKGPPPSDSGAYVLVQAGSQGRGSVLVTAQDLFFALTPVGRAVEMISYNRDHLPPYYKVKRPPAEVTIANHTFARFDYTSAEAGLQWTVLATEVRCHLVKIVFTGRDAELLESLVRDLDKLELPDEASTPACIAGYANAETLVARVEPAPYQQRFNAIPVRIIIGTNGKVKHIHVLSAFPDQARSITDALMQWRFNPHPTEVETGIVFGASRERTTSSSPSGRAARGESGSQ
jgi:hypothetical protein